MSTNVGTLHKKRTLRKWGSNEILDLQDEADGGWIIRKGQIVNQVKFDELVQKELDKQKAREAPAQMVESPNAEARNGKPGDIKPETPDKVVELEKKVAEQDKKLDLILSLLQK
jgi:hypothetical protein